MSEITKLIKSLKKQLYHYKKNYQMYKDLYHGTIPDKKIHVKREDYMKMVEKSRKYDTLMNANSEIVQNNISLTEIYQKMKHLNEENQNLKEERISWMNKYYLLNKSTNLYSVNFIKNKGNYE